MSSDEQQLKCVVLYRELLDEFQFRCHRAALMNYDIAAYHDKWAFRLEAAAGFFGACSVTAGATWILKKITPLTVIGDNILGFVGISGVIIVIVAGFIGKGSNRLYPSFSQRATDHNNVASKWQGLQNQAVSYIKQLDSHPVDEKTFIAWYEKLNDKRQEVCAMAIIDVATYKKYDAKKVIDDCREREEMFEKYKKMLAERTRANN